MMLLPSSDSAIDSKIVKSLTMSFHSFCATGKTRSYLNVIPVDAHSNGKSICTYSLLNNGFERTFCEKRLIDEMDLCYTHVKLAIETLSTGKPLVHDTIAVFYSTGWPKSRNTAIKLFFYAFRMCEWKCEWRELFGNASGSGDATTPNQT